MSDLLNAQTGRLPWEPAEDAALVAVYDRFNVPTIGVVEQHGAKFLFWCILGHGDPASLWAYVHVHQRDLSALEGSEHFDDVFAETVIGRHVTIAMAADRTGILSVFSIGPQDSLDDIRDAAMEIVTDVSESTGRLKDLSPA